MRRILTILFWFLISSYCHSQTKIPGYYKQVKSFNDSLKKIIHGLKLDSTYDVGEDGKEQVSFAVINLSSNVPVLGGFNMENFIYPASVYKMYVAMEILKQASNKNYSLFAPYVVRSPNDVDKIKEIIYDPRPLLKNGDTVTINYLLDLMITRSDNSAANCLIDIATRKKINESIAANGWQGSEVTRKFLSRTLEDSGYDKIKSTETCALHAADFMFKVFSNTLINPWVSMQMKALLARQLDTTKLSRGLPNGVMFYHKTGWWSFYTNDAGIVDDGTIKYIIALFTPVEEDKIWPVLKELSNRVYTLIKSLNQVYNNLRIKTVK